MVVRFHKNDLPDSYDPGKSIAIDTETMGLNPQRDRLCVIQLSTGDGDADVVQIVPGASRPEKLLSILADKEVLKIFHYARFDLGIIYHSWGVMPQPVYCTKIASRLVRTYTDKHGLKDLTRELLGIEVSKQQQSSDWGASQLTPAQLDYAASDVLHLHSLKTKLDIMLSRENRFALAEACFDFLPSRAILDISGWPEKDIFAHS